MVTTVDWTTFAIPSTLVNVGTDAVCMLCDNILCFTDLRTKAISYYKAESLELGRSISAMTGHNRFPMVAFSEVVLKPAVHIIQYPDFRKYAVFNPQNIVTFVDIRFSDQDLLLALSGYSNYTLCIWNFRTGQLLVQHDTLKESLPRSLLCSYHHIPQIVQFSKWNHQIIVWEMCYSATGVDLHEVSMIELREEFTLSNIDSFCYGDDNSLYAVDNYGNVLLVEVAQFYLKTQWSIAESQEDTSKHKLFLLENHKQGLLVYNTEVMYYLRKKQYKWQCEWKFENPLLGKEGLQKCISNGNGEIYTSARIGNLYNVEAQAEEVILNPININNENSQDFVILKGVKEECMIQLTTESFLKCLEMDHYLEHSKLEIPNAHTIFAHNIGPYVMVGTTCGKLHFVNYNNIREPYVIATLETEHGVAIASVQLLDDMAIYHTIYYDFYLVQTDFNNQRFKEIYKFEQITENMGICQCFLAEQNRIFMFLNRVTSNPLPNCKFVIVHQWLPENKSLQREEFELPHTYRDVCELSVPVRNNVEFFAVRLESALLDYFIYKTDTNEFVLKYSIKASHLSNINGIVGSRNLLTWGVDGTYVHYRNHKKSLTEYGVCQVLQIKYRPRVVQKVLDCFNGKYLVYMYSKGGIKVMRPSDHLTTIENKLIICDPPTIIKSQKSITTQIDKHTDDVKNEHTPEELLERDKLLQNFLDLGKEVTDLINYDMSVTGKSQGIFKKFCLNHFWLEKLTEEAQKLCEAERKSLELSIQDQSRIRDWLYYMIMSTNSGITFKVRAIFSKFSLENYGMRKSHDRFAQMFDLYRFYDLQSLDIGEDEEVDEPEQEAEEIGLKKLVAEKETSYFKIDSSAYDHVLSEHLALQDINMVTANQMYNQDAKIRILLTDSLKYEFNKKFEEIRKIKSELMEAIWATNVTLTKIYENMNCMLKLLERDTFQPPQLSRPEWQKDEFVKSLMEVDDSEIKAINRRRKKEEVKEAKRGRLLLWAVEFWVRSLMTMMDGVLEKLWEEEIKKNIPQPEFLSKKEPAEYTLEDQKALKIYEEQCRVLEEDRKKYLAILRNNEDKTNELKTNYILKLNENVTEMMILKLKYDFAIKHVRLRNWNTKVMYFKKQRWLGRIKTLRKEIDLLSEYILKYSKLVEFWSKAVEDLRLKVDNLALKDKSVDRQFKSQFLNLIPQHLGPEMLKSYKKRPKTLPKFLNSTLTCKELSVRVNTKSQPKYQFPLPKDFFEFLDGLTALDDSSHMPPALEARHWEQFVKLRRQKIETELKVRAVTLQMTDGNAALNNYSKELANLKATRLEATRKVQESQEEYFKLIQNQTLELRLTMGQVELNIRGSMDNLRNCVLMHEDDVNDINNMILTAGQMKLKAMQRVAFFRRKVIFKEWEHKMVSANIEYLNNMLYVIGKCKVSIEFLQILRNWEKVKADKKKILNTVGILDKVSEEKLIGFRRQIIRLNDKIAEVRQQIDGKKQANKRVNRQIEQLKVTVAFGQTNRDLMMEEKKQREQHDKMEKIKRHNNLIETVRRDYVHIMELKTILELQRLRTYPTLGPNPSLCSF